MKRAKRTASVPTGVPRTRQPNRKPAGGDGLLAKPNSNGGITARDTARTEDEIDLLDVEAAERRLQDATDKVIPFKSR